MKSKLMPCWLFLALGFSTSASFGAAFSYSYSFAGGLVVSGQLEGDLNGDVVQNISNVTMAFNGLPISGSIYTASYTGLSWSNNPVVSFDVSKNNFLFINSDYLNGNYSYDTYFYVLNDDVFMHAAQAFSDPLEMVASEAPTAQAQWSLTPLAASVPETGSTIAVLGIALAGVAGLRRKLAQ